MAHYAEVHDGVVQRVLVVDNAVLGDPEDEQAGIDFLEELLPGSGTWVQTSYNTHANVHRDGGRPLRYNFAGVGSHWDGVGFYDPVQPFPSWDFDAATKTWQAPVAKPDGEAVWDEASTSWVER